jgi:hypothetical protein
LSPRKRRVRVYDVLRRAVASIIGEPSAPQSATNVRRAASSKAPPDLVARLREATDGLMWMSETDAPVDVFVWDGPTPFSPEALRAHAGIASGVPVEEMELERFFRNATTPQDWHEAAEQEQVRRFTALRDLLHSELRDVRVWRFGDTAKDVYVVGRAPDGTYLGISTKVVET